MKPNAKLLTRTGELVHEFIMIPFQLMPEVCFWGSRVFVLKEPHNQKFGKPAEPIYYEACAWHVAASDYFASVMPEQGYSIIVNGVAWHTKKQEMTYEDVCNLVNFESSRNPSITWAGAAGKGGILSHGQSVQLEGGERFNLAYTGSA